jgi:hypothetical protein
MPKDADRVADLCVGVVACLTAIAEAVTAGDPAARHAIATRLQRALRTLEAGPGTAPPWAALPIRQLLRNLAEPPAEPPANDAP